MTFNITIDTGNAAFDLDSGEEVARILHGLADKIENAGHLLSLVTLRDVNGNTVGKAELIS